MEDSVNAMIQTESRTGIGEQLSPLETWQQLSKNARLVATALAGFQEGITLDYLDNLAEGHRRDHPEDIPINPTAGIFELVQHGAASRKTHLDTIREIISTYETRGNKPPANFSDRTSEREYSQYMGAKHQLAVFNKDPQSEIALKWQQPTFRIQQPYLQFIRERK